MPEPRTPREALDLAIGVGLIDQRRRKQPGAIISNLSDNTRALLRELTSEDAADVRNDCCG